MGDYDGAYGVDHGGAEACVQTHDGAPRGIVADGEGPASTRAAELKACTFR